MSLIDQKTDQKLEKTISHPLSFLLFDLILVVTLTALLKMKDKITLLNHFAFVAYFKNMHFIVLLKPKKLFIPLCPL